MKKLLSTLVVIAWVGVSHSQLTVNDPNAEKREAKNFHAISISSAFDVFISQGNDEAVAVSASEEKYKQDIKVEVKDGVLKIWLENFHPKHDPALAKPDDTPMTLLVTSHYRGRAQIPRKFMTGQLM